MRTHDVVQKRRQGQEVNGFSGNKSQRSTTRLSESRRDGSLFAVQARMQHGSEIRCRHWPAAVYEYGFGYEVQKDSS